MSDFVYPSKYVTARGESVPLKPLMSTEESKLGEIASRVLDQVPEVLQLLDQIMTSGGQSVDYQLVTSAIGKALRVAPAELTEAVCVVLDKDKEWVMENCSISKDYMRILMPVWTDISSGFSSAFDDLIVGYSEDDGEESTD